ncbi:MAG: porin family protein [Clostridium sp.]|nr:porin family protein [Clostridium sp.]
MKKLSTLMLLAVMALCALPVSAQFKYGLEAGLNLSKMSISKDIVDSENRAGWFVGPKVQFGVPLLGLAVDGAVLYSQKYMALESVPDEQNETETTRKTMPYIDIPVNVKWNFGSSRLIGCYLSTGPQWSWYLGGKTIRFDGEPAGILETSNFSWNVGAGINALKHLQLGVTYNIACGKTGELNGWGTMENIKLRNNTWQVRLAYMF